MFFHIRDASDSLREADPTRPEWYYPVENVAGVFGLICGIALWRWKKWGFWGICAGYPISLVMNFAAGAADRQDFLAIFIGPFLHYLVLQIGDENKGWIQLE